MCHNCERRDRDLAYAAVLERVQLMSPVDLVQTFTDMVGDADFHHNSDNGQIYISGLPVISDKHRRPRRPRR